MDPQVNIAEQRKLAKEIFRDSTNNSVSYQTIVAKAVALAELVITLDEWRTKGGYDPYAN